MAHEVRPDFRRGWFAWMLCILVALVAGANFIVFPSSAEAGAAPKTEIHQEAGATLDSVMNALAQSGGVKARFRESRQLTILSEPIKSSGTLYFTPPNWLARHVMEPGVARVIVRENRVSFQDESGTQTLDLGSSEVARAMVGNVMVLMRGDIEALRSQYDVGFAVDNEIWTLDLEPRNRIVRKLIERLLVRGQGNRLVRMESVETSGDITVTEFFDVEVGVEFSPKDIDSIFDIDATEREKTARP